MVLRLSNLKENDKTDLFSKDLLEKTFPGKEDSEFEYSGKCNYCKVEIEFSDVSEVKIIKNSVGDILLYHTGCFERYLRRTID